MYSVKYTLGELRGTVLKLLGRYSSNGTIYNSGEKADIENRLVTSLNIHICRLWNEFSSEVKRYITSLFVPLAVAVFGNIKIEQGTSEERTARGKNLGFYLRVSGKGTVNVEAQGYSRTFTADTLSGEEIVIRDAVGNGEECECIFTLSAEGDGLDVSGFEVYSGVSAHKGEAELLFGNDIRAAYLPSDCCEILGLSERNGRSGKVSCFDVVGEERKILLVPKGTGTEYVVQYSQYPPRFGEGAADGDAVYLSPLMADALVYMCAADLCPSGDPELYSRLTYKYREILENMYPRRRKNGVINKFYALVRKRSICGIPNGG